MRDQPAIGKANLDEIRRSVHEVASNLTPPEPPFEFDLRWGDDYDALLRGEHTTTDQAAILPEAWKSGRVLLQADGGAGKSSLLQRLFKQASEEDAIPVLVDLRRWGARQPPQWDPFQPESSLILDLVLTSLGSPIIELTGLAELSREGHTLLLVDGLNDLAQPTAQSLLQALDLFAQRYPSSAVLVTDRRVRRQLPSHRWRLATMWVRDSFIEGTVGNDFATTMRPLLRLAFFLDWAITEKLQAKTSAEAFQNYFLRHVGLSEAQMDTAGSAAFAIYSEDKSRTFKLQRFASIAGTAVTELLKNAGKLIDEEGDAYFQHHLFHDYLSSRILVGDRKLWNSDVFDAITLDTSSFDVLALALEQMTTTDSADLFLSKVYDWNFYASAYALAKLESPEGKPVSSEMQRALLANLAEKRWDTFRMTAQRVEDALHLFEVEAAGRSKPSLAATLAPTMLALRDLDELQTLIGREQFRTDRLVQWQGLFTAPAGAAVSDAVVEGIVDPDPLIGWTVSNLLKRAMLTPKQVRRVETFLISSPDRTVRWRAAHSLGSHPSDHVVRTLVQALDQKAQWVRYGAIRSLVECAALQEGLRRTVVKRILERLPAIRARDRKVLDELARTLALRTPSKSWVESVAPIVEHLWVTANSIEEQDYWRRLAFDLSRAASGVEKHGR